MAFEFTTIVSWAHLDANGHMANTAYLDLCVDTRFAYLESCGFTPEDFARLRIGPVVRRDEVDYFKEMHLHQAVRVNYRMAGMSDDASHISLRNEIFRPDGKLAACVNTSGGWFDLAARKLIAPPDKLADALRRLERTDDFRALESSVKR